MQNGITLIALVISIIVMLILAGVSINAIVGDNGILSRTQYSTFLSEMTAVEEAVQMWKAGEVIGKQGEETKAIPANGICRVNDLTATDRLVGEVGYYRIWSMTETAPEISIFANSSDFNSSFESEMIFFPAGVQDLYYLNNEAIGIKGDKTYIIDAATGMIYSMQGINLKGISCYSANMATAVMSGNLNAPIFSEAEVSGTGADEKLAGNTQDEFLTDGSKNPNYNPYGFQIIADSTNDNVYKLYNNGDLYAKGVKGIALNSSEEEMENVNPYIWLSSTIPSEIPGSSTNEVEIIIGYNIIYAIDKNRDLWAWGVNDYNKMGLSTSEQIEFSPLVVRKLNVDGQKVKKVIDTNWACFVITESGLLYGSGSNVYGELGIGRKSQQTEKFEKIEFSENATNIKEIYNQTGNKDTGDGFSFILTNSGNLYFAGRHSNDRGVNVILADNTNQVDFVLSWSLVDTQTMFPKLDFTKVRGTGACARWHNSYWLFYAENICYQMNWNGEVIEISPWGECTSIDVYSGYGATSPILAKIIKGDNIEWWYRGINGNYTSIFENIEVENWVDKTDIISSVETNNNKIDEIWFNSSAMVIRLTNGECYSRGNCNSIGFGITGRKDTWTKIEEISGISGKNVLSEPFVPLMVKSNMQLCGTNCVNLIKRENMLQPSWKLIEKDVKYFNAQTDGKALGVVKTDGYLYVRGENSNYLGLNKIGEKISNFTKVTGEGATDEVKNALQSGIKSYNICRNSLYILTNNGNLLVSHRYEDDLDEYSGLQKENHSELVILQENVTFFDAKQTYHISKIEDDVYWWGSGSGGHGVGGHQLPSKLSSVWSEAGNWRRFLIGGNLWLIRRK